MPNSPETNSTATPVAEQKSEPPTIEIRERINRTDLIAEKEKIFLFGDNLAERGLGGQAREMRGEENAVGIPTKKAPDNRPESFFTDKKLAENKRAIDAAFGKIPPDKIIVIPKAGIGTGLAQLAEKAPQTFAYLNEKLAGIGFDNERGRLLIAPKTVSQNKTSNAVVVQSNLENPPAEKRLLDLNDIKTAELITFAPSRAEVDALGTNRTEALAVYADRLRQDYKENKNGLREGFKTLSDALDRGGQITVSCACRAGSEMCHADVVKMAIEKVNVHLKNQQTQEKSRISRADDKNINRADAQKPEKNINQRTQRAINEILSSSEYDKLLETISQTDGRNRSEQASFLGKSSQFVRDIYERGGDVVDGKLIIPTENLNAPKTLAVTSQEHAVKKLGEVLKDESKAKEIAPLVVEYGNKISGLTADGETKIKVFNWIYDSLEGKNEFLDRDGEARQIETSRFNNTLENISRLASEMHELEPLDKIEFVPLAGLEAETNQREFGDRDENRLIEEIYEEAMSRNTTNGIEKSDQLIEEIVQNPAQDGKASAETFERIDLNAAPRLPQEFSESEIAQLLTKTLPEIDRRLESGEKVAEILADFHRVVRQSAQEDALNRLEKIYQKQNVVELKTDKIGELSQSVQTQIGQIDLRRQNVIELKSPNEFLAADEQAHRTFYRQSKQEIGSLLEKLDAVREKQQTSGDKSEENALKKQLNQIKEAKPNFAFKLENSTEIVVGDPSAKALEARNFAQAYINYQHKQPETRLRFESERYRNYAARLESATTRGEVMKTASFIRAENASLGLNWKEMQNGEKDKLPRPLSQKEMQFLFTETSPGHYTQEMTVARLSYAHAGASRRAVTESLLKGEIQPSAESSRLIESLESRLNRRELKDSISATRHFFESLKTPNENLKIKNEFDHVGVYRSLPPQEKDFVYRRTTQQKENLEYRFAYDKSRVSKQIDFRRDDSIRIEASKAEKSFHLLSQYNQARILGEKIESSALVSREIGEGDFNSLAVLLNNQSPEKNELISRDLKASDSSENRKIGEILEVFSRAEITKDEQKMVIKIKLPENSVLQKETYAELLEKFYPDDAHQSEKYKFSSFGEKLVSESREKGQDETVKDFREEIKREAGKENVLGNELSNEQHIARNFETLQSLQEAGRAARQENESILSKYASRAAASRNQNQVLPAMQERKEIVAAALGVGSPTQVSDKTKTEFFQSVQKEITVSDYHKFAANEKLITDVKTGIRKEFTEISQFQNKLEKSKTANATEKNHPKINEGVPQLETTQTFDLAEAKYQEDKVTSNDLTENKPLSLKLYENEIARAEKQLISKSLSAKILAGVSYSESEFNLNLDQIFSRDERQEMKLEAAEIAKSRLEPKELDADHRKISNEASRQAIATFKQLEQAHNVIQLSGDAAKINEAFMKLDREAAHLNKIRQDYTRAEKLAVMREGVKTDIADLLKKNPGARDNDFVEQTGKILAMNLEKAGVFLKSSDNSQVDKLSREIVNRIEAKQKPEVRGFAELSQSQNLTNQNPTKTNTTSKIEKAKDSYVFAR